MSPFLAFAYKPFVSLFSQTSIGVLTYTSIKFSFPMILFAKSLDSFVGLMKQFMAITMSLDLTRPMEPMFLELLLLFKAIAPRPVELQLM